MQIGEEDERETYITAPDDVPATEPQRLPAIPSTPDPVKTPERV